jgi:hypothetical protein
LLADALAFCGAGFCGAFFVPIWLCDPVNRWHRKIWTKFTYIRG